MPTLSMQTDMEFDSKEAMEAFIQGLPIPQINKVKLNNGLEVVDDEDQSNFPGVANITHTFKVKEEK